MKEKWKQIPGYEDVYEVSNKGNVKSLQRYVNSKNGSKRLVRERILKKQMMGRYLSVELNNGKPKVYKIHQLVAMAFLEHTPCGYNIVVDHIDNNPLNNNIDNLQLISQRENNIKDRAMNKTGFRGVSWNEDSKLYEARFRTKENPYGWIGSTPSPILSSMMYEYEVKKYEKSKG
jgi:hypothetical protein